MKVNILIILFSLTLIQVQLNLRAEKRQELLDKLTTKISFSDIGRNLDRFNYDKYLEEDSFHQMSYDINEIKSLMNQYGLPESYNFFEDTSAEKIVKEQGYCGCCWSFASTSALAYRFKKYGIDISLSAQNPVSCYKRDCEGNNIVDPQLNLIKNGTVTEKCFPYKSSDGVTIPKCPSRCEDGSEYKKYYSQNAYFASNDVQQNFNELVILVMDQLVTQGPVMAGFDLHSDFDTFGGNKEKCKNDVYTYDGKSDSRGGHAITFVGYGILNNKIYWLVQNSWNAQWCDNGFIKMEIGQFLSVSFSEPNIKTGKTDPVQIEVNLEGQDPDCNLIVNSSSLNNWNNTLNINFKHEESSEDFDFQIGRNTILGENKIISNYELNRAYYNLKKGRYIFKSFESLGEDNSFKLNSFEGKSFDFYGADQIRPLIYIQSFVTQEGSKFIFRHEFGNIDDNLPPIYMDVNGKNPLSKCEHIKTSTSIGIELGYCEITNDDLAYLKTTSKVTLNYRYLCNYLVNSKIQLALLNTNYYPIFIITQFIRPRVYELTKNTELILVSNVTGGTKYFENEGSQFIVIMEVENNNRNTSFFAICSAGINYENIESNLTCNLDMGKSSLSYQNIYLLPYSTLFETNYPFEVYINTTMKAEGNPTPKPTDSSYLEYSLTLLFGLIMLLF